MAISQKRLKLEVQLLFMTNRNSHLTFRLAISTCDDPERSFQRIDFTRINMSGKRQKILAEFFQCLFIPRGGAGFQVFSGKRS